MPDNQASKPAVRLLEQPLQIINIGLERFATDLEENGTAVIQVDWTPPAGGDREIADLLAEMGC